MNAAVAKAEELLEQQNKLYCLGDIVHNEQEVIRRSRFERDEVV